MELKEGPGGCADIPQAKEGPLRVSWRRQGPEGEGGSPKTTPLMSGRGRTNNACSQRKRAGLEARTPRVSARLCPWQTSDLTAPGLSLSISKMGLTISTSWVVVKIEPNTLCKRHLCTGLNNILYKHQALSFSFLTTVPSAKNPPDWPVTC